MANLSELILEEILSDRSDGAAVLAMRGLDALAQCARENHALEPAAFFVAILRLARRIDALRPAMGAIGTQALLAIDHARQAVENGMAWSEAIPASVAFLKEAAQNANDDIAGYAASVCGTGRRILTCSHSSTLMAAFDRLHPSRVYIGAGEPLGDGVDMAEGLKKRGIPVTVVPDGAIAMTAEKVEMVLVGVDQILNGGAVVNRAGTLAMALAAERFGVPFYALCQQIKISGVEADAFKEEFLPPTDPYRCFESELPLFDVTPGDLVTSVITENGPLGLFELSEITGKVAFVRRTLQEKFIL